MSDGIKVKTIGDQSLSLDNQFLANLWQEKYLARMGPLPEESFSSEEAFLAVLQEKLEKAVTKDDFNGYDDVMDVYRDIEIMPNTVIIIEEYGSTFFKNLLERMKKNFQKPQLNQFFFKLNQES